MADAKVTALSAISAVALADLVYVVDDVAGTPTSTKATVLQLMAATGLLHTAGTDADTTMAVGAMYVVDMSAWATADRTYTLPGTAAVGDRIGIMVTAGNATHELIITAGTGDTLNGINGGTEWSRLFMSYEVVIMRCVVANSTWIVEHTQRLNGVRGGVQPGGRLTLESGVPVSTTDQTGKTTVYYTPFVSNVVPLWDGSDWSPTVFAETSLALGTLTSGLPYDVFGYLSGGALALELLAWTNGTTRAAAVTLQDGRYCKSGDKTRLLLGSFYTTSTTTTEDSAGGTVTQTGGQRLLWNVYNQVRRNLAVIDTTNSWTYNTGSWRAANNAAGNRVAMMLGLPAVVSAELLQSASATNPGYGWVGIGLDTTGASSCPASVGYTAAAATDFMLPAKYLAVVAAGYHYLSWNEYGGAATFNRYGDNGESGLRQSRLTAEVMA